MGVIQAKAWGKDISIKRKSVYQDPEISIRERSNLRFELLLDLRNFIHCDYVHVLSYYMALLSKLFTIQF